MTSGERTRIEGWALVGAQFLLLGLLLFEVLRAPRPRGFRGACTLLAAIAGLAVIAGGSRTLGDQLRAHPAPSDAATLRTDGLYRYVRHPIYAGLLLCALGMTGAARTPRALTCFGALVGLLSVKARFEEALLRARFEDYDAYASRTPRFIPRLDVLVYGDAARRGAGRDNGGER